MQSIDHQTKIDLVDSAWFKSMSVCSPVSTIAVGSQIVSTKSTDIDVNAKMAITTTIPVFQELLVHSVSVFYFIKSIHVIQGLMNANPLI